MKKISSFLLIISLPFISGYIFTGCCGFDFSEHESFFNITNAVFQFKNEGVVVKDNSNINNPLTTTIELGYDFTTTTMLHQFDLAPTALACTPDLPGEKGLKKDVESIKVSTLFDLTSEIKKGDLLNSVLKIESFRGNILLEDFEKSVIENKADFHVQGHELFFDIEFIKKQKQPNNAKLYPLQYEIEIIYTDKTTTNAKTQLVFAHLPL